jgi:uncharacterized protein (TIGR03086 family)
MDTDHDWTDLIRRAHDGFGDRLRAVTDWSAPTPDVEWDVRELVSHVIEEQQWVPLLLAGHTAETGQALIRGLGDDLVAEWGRYSREALDAWRDADPERPVVLSTDRVPAREYLREQLSDVVIHGWDLSRAIGADERIDDDLVRATWTVFEPQRDTLEASGLFASPVPVGEDAPLQVRLLALTGRDAR